MFPCYGEIQREETWPSPIETHEREMLALAGVIGLISPDHLRFHGSMNQHTSHKPSQCELNIVQQPSENEVVFAPLRSGHGPDNSHHSACDVPMLL
jgi:hypothetical protein